MESHETVIMKLLKETSLETRLRIHLQMKDYENWNMGTYKGDKTEEVADILLMVENYMNDTPDPKTNLYE